ncbi:hypothetical protein GC177_05750 [bacterium]|nr:hypothetical protein [bacterium]
MRTLTALALTVLLVAPVTAQANGYNNAYRARQYVSNMANSVRQTSNSLYRPNYNYNSRINTTANSANSYMNRLQSGSRQVQNQLYGTVGTTTPSVNYQNQAQQYQSWKNQVIQKSYGSQRNQ